MAFFLLSPGAIAAPPISSITIDDYLQDKDSPLANHGTIFVESGQEWNLDPRLVVAIAGAETTFGKRICTDFNAWNWFFEGAGCSSSRFASWEEGIRKVTRGLRLFYFDRYEHVTIPLIQARYCAEGCDHWIPLVTEFYHDELGGDLDDLTFSPEAANGGHALSLTRSLGQHGTISDSNQADLSLAASFTIEAWVKPSSVIPPGQEYVLVSKWSPFRSEKSYVFLYYHDGQRTTLGLGTAATATSDDREVYMPYILPVGQWTHVAVVFTSATGSAEFFVNGQSVGSAAGLGATVNDGDGAFQIGTRNGLTATVFDGLMDEIRVWNLARTPAELARDYAKALVGTEQGLVGYWQFECNGSDTTENDNDVSFVNAPPFVADVPFGSGGAPCN
jgi:hypothetical protein